MKFWDTPKNILVILAHPDDPEFFCGATIAEWVKQGNKVSYCLLTKGDKGVNKEFQTTEDIRQLRMDEQTQAARQIGVEDITFLDNEDGYLVPTLELRKEVTRVIRQKKPQIMVTCDPTNYFMNDDYINHPDHRAAGQIAIDAVFPAAGNPLFFTELITDEHLYPHGVEEVWLSLPKEPNLVLDVTNTWEKKVAALMQHHSQIGDQEAFKLRMSNRRANDSSDDTPRFEESFKRIVFK